MFKKLMPLIMVCLISVSLIGCSSAPGGSIKKTETKKQIKVGFANLSDGIDFGQSVKKSIVDAGEKAGYKVIAVDNNLDGATAVSNADNLITQQIDFFIEFNVDSKVAPAIMDKMNAAKIPVLAVDIPLPGAVFFGANNPEAGKIAGRALAAKAKEKWNSQVDLVILVGNPAAGEVPQQRMDGTLAGIRETIDVPDNKIVKIDGKNDVLNAQRTVTDTLTANPGKHHILIGCLNDQNGQGALAGAETSNREKDVLIASQGADKPAIENLRTDTENAWIGSTAYTPEKYGDYIMPLVTKILAGEKVEQENHPLHFFLDKSNIAEKYPK